MPVLSFAYGLVCWKTSEIILIEYGLEVKLYQGYGYRVDFT